jgi:hypothetical protein
MQVFGDRRTVLGCEHLEGRDCPAIIVLGSYMAVVGTSAADAVAITDDGAGTVTATLNGTTRTATGIQTVAVLTFGGNDSISYTLTGAQSGRRAVAVDAGAGDDTVSLTGGAVGGLFAFAATGGAGTDTLSATVAGEIDGYLAVALDGGFGNDTVSGNINVAAGSTGTVAAVVNGGFGNDNLTLTVTGDGLATLEALVAVMNGGPGTDTGVSTPNVRRVSVEA